MNPSTTLANRFRTHRTDRIRVDGKEVLSVVELRASLPTSLEVVFEQCRNDLTEALVVESAQAPMSVWRTVPVITYATSAAPAASEFTIDAHVGAAIEFVIRPDRRSVIRLWNAWELRGVHHAWTGNSGIITEELDAPPGADRRVRLWCSDGFGNPTFDDLVAVVTLGPALQTEGDDDRVIRSLDAAPRAKWRSGGQY